MSKKRMIDTRFWHDGWIRELNALDRYLFLYLMTNDKCSFCGIYELPVSLMAFECGIDERDLEKTMLPRLEPKVFFYDGWVCISNFKRHHVSEKSINSIKGYDAALSEVPSRILKYFKVKDKPLKAPSSPSDTIASASTSTIASASIKKKKPFKKTPAYLLNVPDEDIKKFTKRFQMNEKQVRSKAEDLDNWRKSKGITGRDWQATLLNAIKGDFAERVEIKKPVAPEPEIELTEAQKEKNAQIRANITKMLKKK